MKVLVMNCSPVRNGATAEIVNIVTACLQKKHDVKNICIDDYDIKCCKGCRTCHNTAKCVQKELRIGGKIDSKSYYRGCSPTCELDNEDSLKFHLKMGFAEANRIICFTKRLTDLEE